jgi:hypothetical protein
MGVDIHAAEHDAGHEECGVLGMGGSIDAKLAGIASGVDVQV